jgi:4-amino-4-deoxy-L-arabinose transferase-like glycosyltransferase
MYGAVAMIPYYIGFALFVFLAARTRYKAPFYLYLAAIMCALSVLAKGLAGLGLPVIVFVAYLAFTGTGAARSGAAALRHLRVADRVRAGRGAVAPRDADPPRPAFWNELFGDNHWRRMVIGRHGDRGTFEYSCASSAYGLLPWIALVPAALGWRRCAPGAARRARRTRRAPPMNASRASSCWARIWFVAGYAMVSLSMTKFHHYVLPAIPGIAIVVGCFLDDLIARGGWRRGTVVALIGIRCWCWWRSICRHQERRAEASCGCSRTTTCTTRAGGRGRNGSISRAR